MTPVRVPVLSRRIWRPHSFLGISLRPRKRESRRRVRGFEALEERSLLQDLLARTILSGAPGGAIIGGAISGGARYTGSGIATTVSLPHQGSPADNSVQVLIGGEGTWEELRHFSVVLARYGTPGLATGTLGVLGPMRMSYARTIPTVRFVAGLLSNLVTERIDSAPSQD